MFRIIAAKPCHYNRFKNIKHPYKVQVLSGARIQNQLVARGFLLD